VDLSTTSKTPGLQLDPAMITMLMLRRCTCGFDDLDMSPLLSAVAEIHHFSLISTQKIYHIWRYYHKQPSVDNAIAYISAGLED
jgi:hypothetical protein